MSGIIKNIKQTSKNTARDIARRIAKEPFEVLKDVPEQIFSFEKSQKYEDVDASKGQDKNQTLKNEAEQKDKKRSASLRQAYEAELGDIRREKIFKNIQTKISLGEPVNLSSYPDLSWEQKEVLRAQAEAIKNNYASRKENDKILDVPVSRPKRGLFSGVKTRLARMERKTENRLPPSG